MKTTLFSLLTIVTMLAGCTNNPIATDQTQVVLQGYLYAHEAVTDIQLGYSMPIGGSDSVQTPITNASVTLVKNGTHYQLIPNPTQAGYYYYPASDLAVNVGDTFTLVADAGNTEITAQTIVPPRPEQLALSVTKLRFQSDSVQVRFGTRFVVAGLDTATVSWSNPAGEYYFVVIESIDPNRKLMRPDSTVTRRFVSQPTAQSAYQINNNSILYTGKHILRLYHVNKEYADLYRSRVQDSRALNEPLTNVQNGLGIFSAFASDSLSFTVVLN